MGNSSSKQKFCSFLADYFVFLMEVMLTYGDLDIFSLKKSILYFIGFGTSDQIVMFATS